MLVILKTSRIMKGSGGSRGGSGGGRHPPPLLLDQTEVRPKGRKNCFGRPPPPQFLRVCLTSPIPFPSPPPPLSSRSGSGTEVKPIIISSVPRTLFSFLIERVDDLKLPLIIPGLIHFSLIISERTYNRNRKRTSKQAIAMMIVIYLQCDN